MSDALIELRDLSFAYDTERPVLRGANLELVKDERVGLVGANGSGKTTLLHLLVGLQRPTAGEVWAFGKKRRKESEFWEVRARAGLLFQDPEDQLFSPTVAEDVAFGPLNLGWSRDRVWRAVRRTLAALYLEGYEDRITYKLSGGEKRLVSLACVLAMDPEVLLLDEPVAGLDDEMRERLARILVELHHPMLVVSHDREFLARTTDRAQRLHQGRIEPFDLHQPVPHKP
jgi:cobalt/nickel transport system ATP-binding protein